MNPTIEDFQKDRKSLWGLRRAQDPDGIQAVRERMHGYLTFFNGQAELHELGMMNDEDKYKRIFAEKYNELAKPKLDGKKPSDEIIKNVILADPEYCEAKQSFNEFKIGYRKYRNKAKEVDELLQTIRQDLSLMRKEKNTNDFANGKS